MCACLILTKLPASNFMKRGVLILVLGLVAAMVVYGCVYFACMSPARSLEQSSRPELAWLRDEFKLNDAEFKRVSELHAAYLPQCREMCRKIDAQNQRLGELVSILLLTGVILIPRDESEHDNLLHFVCESETKVLAKVLRLLQNLKSVSFLIANDIFINGVVTDTTAGSATVSWSFVPAP